MANFLYNGVELPDINTVWTDKETYPYVYIAYRPSMALYGLTLSNVSISIDSGSSNYVADTNGNIAIYALQNGEWKLNSTSPITAGQVVGTVAGSPMIWCNHNILNEDGSVYLAASTPIRAGSKLQISAGGYYSYNSVLLPPLPEYDKAVYPYATIFRTASDPTFMLVLTSQPQIISNDNLTCASDFAIDVYYSFAATNYTEFGHYEAFPRQVSALWNIATTSLLDQGWAWANHDVLLHDNSVFVPASEPVPCFPKVYYEGTEPCAYSSVFGAYVSSELLNEPGPSVGDTVYVIWDGVPYEDVVTTAAAFGNAPMFGDLTLSTRPYVIGYMDIDGNGEAGWFFATGTSGEHTLKVYSVIEGGEVTATTANVAFTCTDLENTDPIDSICAWVYKKSDGLNTTIPPTWTSEMFSAPAYSTTHTFTGLTPNTEYEVYGCIFVNGEATDHNAIAEFTTLEGSGGGSGGGGSGGGSGGDDETGSGHYGMVEDAIHEIVGGTARVNGAGCEIADGRARTGGAWYELNFSGEGGDVGGDDTELNTGVLFEGGIAAAPIQYQVVNTSNALVNISPTAGIEDDYIFTNCGQGQIVTGQTVVYPPIPIVAQIGPVDLSGFSTLHMTVSASGSVIFGYGNTLATANSPNLTDYVTSPNVDINTKVELTVDIGSVSGEQYIKFCAANTNTTARAYKIWLT